MLQQKYLLDRYKQELFLKFHHFQKNLLSVEQYVSEFEELMLKCDLTEPEENTVDKFLSGPSRLSLIQSNCNLTGAFKMQLTWLSKWSGNN